MRLINDFESLPGNWLGASELACRSLESCAIPNDDSDDSDDDGDDEDNTFRSIGDRPMQPARKWS